MTGRAGAGGGRGRPGAQAAHRPGPHAGFSWPGLAGLATAAAVGALMLGTLGVVIAHAGALRLGPADWAAIRFTVVQAALSALISVALAVPVARALARRGFPLRSALIAAMGAPFLLPVIVAVLGLVAIFGRGGMLNSGLAGLGLPPLQIYGLHGVVLAHVFLNLPLATRMLLQGWQTIPAERVRLAQALDLPPGAFWRHVEYPMLRTVLPGASLAIFLICLTSFAVALILGGGPRATTIELAIYQAVRFDFDLARAATLAALQFLLCATAVLLAARALRPSGLGAGLDRPLTLPAPEGWRRGADAGLLVLVSSFLLAPLVVIVARGLPGLAELPLVVWQSAARSLALAGVVALSVPLAAVLVAMAVARGGRAARSAETLAMLPMAASGLVLGTGLFLAILPFTAPGRLALPVTALVNGALALPFALRLILPAVREAETSQGRLADALGLTGRARLRHVIMPRIMRPLGLSAGLAGALAMGDLGVIALFATEDAATLPMQVWRLMGAYRTEAAEAAALLLVVLSLAMFTMFDLWGRARAGT